MNTPQWKCTVCGRVGSVGRCCGLGTREPLNDAAREEHSREKAAAERSPALTWDDLARLYDADHPDGPRARTLPLDTIWGWAVNQPTRFYLRNTDGTLHKEPIT